MASTSNSPTDFEVNTIFQRDQTNTYYLRERRSVNYVESPIIEETYAKRKRKQRSKSSNGMHGMTLRKKMIKRTASVPPNIRRTRQSSESFLDESNDENEDVRTVFHVPMERTPQKSRTPSPKNISKVGRRGRNKSCGFCGNEDENRSVERQVTYANGRPSEILSPETSSSRDSQGKERKNSTHKNAPQENNPENPSEIKKGKNCSSKNHTNKGRRNSTGAEPYQESNHQHVPSETSKGRNGDYAPELVVKMRRKSMGDKSRQESSRNATVFLNQLMEGETKFKLVEKRLEAMYREDDRKQVPPKKTRNSKQGLKISVPLEKIFDQNLNDTAELMEILSKENYNEMAHFKKKLIQRSVPTDHEPTEESAQSSSSLGAPQKPISSSSKRADELSSTSQDLISTSPGILILLSTLEKSPASTPTPVSPPPSQASGDEPEERQGVKRQTSSTPVPLDYSPHASSDQDPILPRRPRSNSANQHPKTDKTPRINQRQQDVRNMNCTITRPNSIPVNIQIGVSNDSETTKTLLVLVDSIMRNDVLSVENLMALNKFYRDLKIFQFMDHIDKGLKREIEDRTKQLVRYVGTHLFGAQCNISYIERMLGIDLQQHEQFFRRNIRNIKHYARDEQSMETLIKNLLSSKEIVLPAISPEVQAKVAKVDLQQNFAIRFSQRHDPRNVQAGPSTLHYTQLQDTRSTLPFNEVPGGSNFRMINPAHLQYYDHQVHNGVYHNRPMSTVSASTYSPLRNNNQNWRGPIQMMRPTNYPISRMLIPSDPRSDESLLRGVYNTPSLQSTRPALNSLPAPPITELRNSNGTSSPRFPSSNSRNIGRFTAPYDINMNNSVYPSSQSTRPALNSMPAPPNITELRNSNGTSSPRFPSSNSRNIGRFTAPYDINMNNPAYPPSLQASTPAVLPGATPTHRTELRDSNGTLTCFPSLNAGNIGRFKAPPYYVNMNGPAYHEASMAALQTTDQRNIVSTTQTPTTNVNNTDATPTGHFIQPNPRNILRHTSPVDNTDMNNLSPTASTSFAHQNQINGSRFMPSSNTERSNPYVHSNLRSNGIEVGTSNNVACSKKSPMDTNAVGILQQTDNNSNNVAPNKTLIRRHSTSENITNGTASCIKHEKDKEAKSIVIHPVEVVDESMSVTLTSYPIREQVEHHVENSSVTKSDSVKSEGEDIKNPIATQERHLLRYYAEELKGAKRALKQVRESDVWKDPKNFGVYQQLFLDTSENDSSVIIVDDNDEIDNDVCFVTQYSQEVFKNNSRTKESSSRAIKEYIPDEIPTIAIRENSSSLQGGQIVKDNSQQMLRLSNAEESIHVKLQTSDDIRGDGYPPQFQQTGNNVGNTTQVVPFQSEPASDSTDGIQDMDWRDWMSHEGERRISNIHETPRNYSIHDEWFQIGYTDTAVSKTESIIKMVQSKLEYDEMNHSLVSRMEDANGNERRIELSLPSNVNLSSEDYLSDPELYIKEYRIVANHAPLGYLQYYQYVTGFQIVRNKPPVSFLTFLQLNNAGQLQQLFKKFIKSLGNNGNENTFSPL